MGGNLVGDVAGGAAKPGELAFIDDRARRHTAVTVLPGGVIVVATQVGQLLRVAVGLVVEPGQQGRGVAGQQLVERLA
ncbi:hypothetical protein WR25_25865 [Diploscapter pachys]|uniref:Uncharacterized protein n=1 Tax=Diploscapter pachys TaxID=2018661 RepID=A0A2A2K5Y5_9BILA|nr:hypothetical protein WR25_25865 [Diploscapter pachys]